MADDIRRKPPLPTVISFLACREVLFDQRTRSTILIGPTSHVPLSQFPTQVVLSVWAEFTGGHGVYHPALRLLDESEEAVWAWDAPAPLGSAKPLSDQRFSCHDILIPIPRLGRYRLVLLLNGEEAAQRPLWCGPDGAFRT